MGCFIFYFLFKYFYFHLFYKYLFISLYYAYLCKKGEIMITPPPPVTLPLLPFRRLRRVIVTSTKNKLNKLCFPLLKLLTTMCEDPMNERQLWRRLIGFIDRELWSQGFNKEWIKEIMYEIIWTPIASLLCYFDHKPQMCRKYLIHHLMQA